MAPGMLVLLRTAAAVLGGYFFSAALVALLAASLPLLGLPRSEAVVSAALPGYLLYLMVLLWSFSVHSLVRLGSVLAGGIALAYGLLLLIR